MDYRILLLLLELAMSLYNVGTIWAHEMDIFRTWKLVGVKEFHTIQTVHWKKLPYWIFTPAGLARIGAIVLVWYHPAGSPFWAVRGTVVCQASSLILTIFLWRRWQAQLSQDPSGPKSLYLTKILQTHWVRTVLVTAVCLLILLWTIQLFAAHVSG